MANYYGQKGNMVLMNFKEKRFFIVHNCNLLRNISVNTDKCTLKEYYLYVYL